MGASSTDQQQVVLPVAEPVMVQGAATFNPDFGFTSEEAGAQAEVAPAQVLLQQPHERLRC